MNLSRATISLLFVAFTLATVGCASTSQSTTRNTPSAIPQDGRGRITFYRPNGIFGYAQRADILLDGSKVGKSVPGVKFCVDTTPGTHHISVPNVMYPGERTLDVTVRSKEVAYVKTSLDGTAYGGRTKVEAINASQGAQETANLKLVSSQ